MFFVFLFFSDPRFFIIGIVLFISILLSYCYPSMFMFLSISSFSILYYLIPWYFYASFFPFIYFMFMLDVHLPMHLCFIHVNTGYSYCDIAFIFICYLLTCLIYWNSQKIAKKKVHYKCSLVVFFVLWYEWNNSRVYIFLYTHTCVKFCVLNICDMF